MEHAVSEIVSSTDSQETKLRKIYARCQQIRNLSYESRKTAEEAKRDLKPNQNVEELYKNGYGYGRDITWLFLALARAAGFDAYPVMVSSRREYFFNPARMNASD
jgi:transglutaminase-like putative cysteine protease